LPKPSEKEKTMTVKRIVTIDTRKDIRDEFLDIMIKQAIEKMNVSVEKNGNEFPRSVTIATVEEKKSSKGE